jgi:lipopolysaccharide transport system permease protein
VKATPLQPAVSLTTKARLSADHSAFSRLYRARWLVFELVTRDLRLRYRGSVLGFAWTLLNPLLFMGVYLLVFGTFLHLGFHNYALYLLSGNLAYIWFASSLNIGTEAVRAGRMFVGKTVFPPEVLLLVPVLSGAVNFALSMPILLIASVALHQHFGPSIVLLPVLMLGEALLAIGLLFFFSTLNVFYRDFGQLETYFVLMLLYLTPIFYQVQSIPEPWQKIVLASPVAALIISYHDILFFGRFPALSAVAYVFAVGIGLCVAGYAFFSHYRESFGELL